MLFDSQGKRLWITDETGGFAPVRTHADIQGRPRGNGVPDWWVVGKDADWQPPEPASLLSLGAAEAAEASTGGFGGEPMKIGAGRKPQPYNPRTGEYEGGLSGGHAVRGKVSHEVRGPVPEPPRRAGAAVKPSPLSPGGRVGVSTANDESGKKAPAPGALRPETREQVQKVLDERLKAQTINMNSGYRTGDRGKHGEGLAVDINRIDGQKVSDAIDQDVSEQQRETMRKRLTEIRGAAEGNKQVEAYIAPLGGYFSPKDPQRGNKGRTANDKDVHDHRHHVHITIRKQQRDTP